MQRAVGHDRAVPAERKISLAARNECSPRSTDALLADLAARQHGVVALGQLTDLGLSPAAVSRRAARGLLHRVCPGVYAVGHPGITRRGHWLAAVLSAGPDAVLSHTSAAALLGILRAPDGPTHVTAGMRKGRRGRDIRIHVSSLSGDERTRRAAIPVTEPMRTLLDLAALLGRHRLQRAADLAGISQAHNRARLAHLLDRHRGRRGAASLRAVLAAAEREAAVPRSIFEDRLRAVVAAAGLPSPAINERERTTGRRYELDASWPDLGLALELDGWASHRTREAFERDRERDRRLTVAGWRVVRLTWRQLRDEPELVTAHLRALLVAAGPHPARGRLHRS